MGWQFVLPSGLESGDQPKTGAKLPIGNATMDKSLWVKALQKNGLPVGTYRVTLGEKMEIPQEFTEDVPRAPRKAKKFFEKQKKYFAEHHTLPEILCDSKTTPIELVVQEPSAKLTIDVSNYQNEKSK
ncbi:MAG: hypothetical protein LBE12_11975 [Planctomycetaceae bacterium]|nr:hypothetical protein [Planctomycetaceae bacterium]